MILRMALALALAGAGLAQAQPASPPPAKLACSPAPQLQPGKTQLLERYLTRPGAQLTPLPGGGAGKPIPAFTPLFVYDRSPDGKAIQVGTRSDCKPEGWVASAHLVLWRHVMVAAFTPRVGRDPVLFFGSPDQPKSLLAATDSAAAAQKLKTAAAQSPSSAGIVSREPDTPVDIEKQFYLLPILEGQHLRFASGSPATLLHVAALTKAGAPDASSPSSPPPAGAPSAPKAERHNFRTAVVFVLDATKSMDPYLDRTRQALDQILAKVEAQHLESLVRFGLVAFRDDPKAVRNIEYGTRIFVDPNKVATRAAFDKAVVDLRASKVSSRAVAEDAYAGVEAALDHIDWSGFDGRYIVLVTDASAREPGSGIATTSLDEHALAIMAREKGIALMAVHLLTPEGGDKDHKLAEGQYSRLTVYPSRGSLYYPVQAGDVAQFGKRVDVIADSLVQLIQSAEDTGTARSDQPKAPATAAKKTDPAAAAADIAAVGYAMRLAYLGKVEGSTAPTMFEAWTLDRDLANQEVASVSIRVLLSRSQLSDLAATVSALYDAFKKGRDDPNSFYEQLRSAALTLSRDPNKIQAAGNRNLSDAILGEYLDGLPYASRVMAMDEDQWTREMSPGDQEELIDSMAVKLELYRHMQDDVSHWVKLAPDAAPEDAVYPVPLDALP
jgi:serine/threonine-protein kinase PpkA